MLRDRLSGGGQCKLIHLSGDKKSGGYFEKEFDGLIGLLLHKPAFFHE